MKSTANSATNEIDQRESAESSTDIMPDPAKILSALQKNVTLLSMGTLNRKLEISGKENFNNHKARATNTPWFNDFVRNEMKKVFEKKTISCEVEADNKYYKVHAFPLQYRNAYVDKIMYVAMDVTREKLRELELVQALEKEKELGELKSKFVSMASHEFRNPLTSILASAFLLSQPSDNEEEDKQTHLGRIKRSVNKLTHVLNEFHALQKLEENKVEPVYTLIDVQKLIEEDVLSELDTVKKANQRIDYVHNGSPLVNLDYSILQSIVTNLTSNALRFSESDVAISTEVSPSTFSVEIRDEGIGIPEDQHHQVFERYFRGKNAAAASGTGLGLHLAKRYVELLGGAISFKSGPDAGTTFTINIPLKKNQTKTKNSKP